ncbi:WXG100 family type VII secretion target [Chloroflexus islandicus]|uniref:WXG100 family type VII secretion target n=1 Tax=Chloroflexus islandicus TaxID=1707952 RepID=UPI0009ED71D1|nr:WXG100 family type VII secretion target [Chloroflexus islandicus]
MGLIGADIDQLRATIATMRQGSATLQEALQRAMQAMQAMQSGPWAGQHRQQAEAVWERIQAQFTPTLSALEHLTARTEHFANNLAEAGRSFYNPAQLVYPVGTHQHVSPPVVTHQHDTQPPGATAQEAISDELWLIERTGELFDGFLKAVEGLVILGKSIVIRKGLSVRPGTSYPKQLKIFGTKETLELTFLNPHLRHMKGNIGNITKHFIANPTWKAFKEEFKNAPSTFGISFAFGLATNAYDNWNEYKNDSQAVQKMVVGTTIDAAVDATCVTIGTAAGTFVGGAIGGTLLGACSGGLLAPLGTAIGARVGGWLGGWAGECVSENIVRKWDKYQDFKQYSVQQGADLIDKAVENTTQMAAQASQTAQQALETTSKAAQQLIEQGQQVQQAVSYWVDDKLKSWLNWK